MEFPKKRSEYREWQNTRNAENQNFNTDRKNTYGPIEKQLDMLWHDIDNGIIPGKDGSFYNYIKKVKSIVKKPNFDIDEYYNYDFSKETFEEDLE